MNTFDQLEGRHLVKQMTDWNQVRNLLEKPTTFYIGFDPTADSLHVGHLLQILTARRMVEDGHSAVMVIGDATAKIGDPSGKTSARPMMASNQIEDNAEAIGKQIRSLMPKNNVWVVRNSNWARNLNLLDFMQEVGAHFSVNNMLRADCFKSRMEQGLTFLEFSYMLLQSFDFFWLNKIWGVNLQIGGDDQWSNMLGGIDLIRKKTGKESFALTLPLLLNPDGTKMGKTERGTIWLDPKKTSPFDFFQFWRNVPDPIVLPLIRQLTFLTFDQIMHIPFGMKNEDVNNAKKILALEVTKIVHGEEAAQESLKRAEALFEGRDTSELDAFEISDGMHILDLLVGSVMAKSKTEARNLINNKGVSINDEVLTDPTTLVTISRFGKTVMLRKGKKHFRLFHLRDKNE